MGLPLTPLNVFETSILQHPGRKHDVALDALLHRKQRIDGFNALQNASASDNTL